MASNLDGVNLKIVSCTRCDRLVRYCQEISSTKKRMYINEDYWGKPVPSLGNHDAEVLIIGLAPAAHGANRTGRVFTGEQAKDFGLVDQIGDENDAKLLAIKIANLDEKTKPITFGRTKKKILGIIPGGKVIENLLNQLNLELLSTGQLLWLYKP